MRTYTLNLDWDYGLCTGRNAAGQQYLLGPHANGALAFVFSEAGEWLSMEELAPSSQSYEDQLDAFLKLHAITTGPITVSLFYLDPYNIGLRDLPAHWDAFLTNRNSVSQDKHAEYETNIADWRAQQAFVLLWGSRDFWLDGSGEITAS